MFENSIFSFQFVFNGNGCSGNGFGGMNSAAPSFSFPWTDPVAGISDLLPLFSGHGAVVRLPAGDVAWFSYFVPVQLFAV